MDILRRIAERGIKVALEQRELAGRFVDIFQHLLDEIARVPVAPQPKPVKIIECPNKCVGASVDGRLSAFGVFSSFRCTRCDARWLP